MSNTRKRVCLTCGKPVERCYTFGDRYIWPAYCGPDCASAQQTRP